MLRPSADSDFAFVREHSSGPTDDQLYAQIRDGRLWIIEVDRRPIGFIKSCVLWETLPFIEVIVIEESERGNGYGRKAVRSWEAEMVRQGYELVLISTQKDETAQHFWRKLGYSDCGTLSVPGKPQELFLQRGAKDIP
jgi:ribosomal protein S18 acetylase RimI-like enzyme